MKPKKEIEGGTPAPRKTSRTKRLLLVDGDLHARCEAIATARRKQTGAATPLWSEVAREAMAAGLKQCDP